MWTINEVYGFTPSGDASELAIRIVRKASPKEASDWWHQTYKRPVQGSGQAYKAVITIGGFDANKKHRVGEDYFVYASDFDPSKHYHQGYD